ncbi:mitochondrial carrier domain-containing protein [Hyaloraphidium curvatum]|nr:mitochondrial carrier domain-containing protein [Hyaloraphidium curvatum]
MPPASAAGPPARLSPFGEAVAGAAAAAFANLLVYPLDVVSTRMQVQSRRREAQGNLPDGKPGLDHHASVGYASTLDGLVKIFEQEGVTGLYAGLQTSMAATLLNNFSYFYAYSIIRRAYIRANPEPPSTIVELLLGMLAGACARICTTPVNVVTTRQQARPALTSLDILRDILDRDGPKGLYAGLPAALVLTVNPAITYGLNERMKTLGWPKGAFARGALGKAVATIVTYPYILAKVKLQFGGGGRKYSSAMEVLTSTVGDEGFFALYKGLDAQLSKSVLTQAILLVAKDWIEARVLAVVVWHWMHRNGPAKVV